jgi:hypothetical protein
MVMPYTAIQFAVLHKLKTFAAGSSKTGIIINRLISSLNLILAMNVLLRSLAVVSKGFF